MGEDSLGITVRISSESFAFGRICHSIPQSRLRQTLWLPTFIRRRRSASNFNPCNFQRQGDLAFSVACAKAEFSRRPN